ncbi:MAG: hypothetical protein E5Y61_05505 [Mesorhizobium sp.]|nr:MAG: hypothetical protein E5Y61_05505 [Mesorhizobium sp.]
MPLELKITKAYPNDLATDCWRGLVIDNHAEFDLYLRGPVWERVTDAAFEKEFSADLDALATTGMASDTLSALLDATVEPLDWEIGEAMAECLLTDEHGAVWPWNENRDRKTPKASLPGADIVGFLGSGPDTVFLFGEVKTSSDKDNPPGVMAGRGGLAHQIDLLANHKDAQNTLLKWLYARCTTAELMAMFKIAAAKYLSSGGKDFAVVGVLLRDTPAHRDDLRTRGTALDDGTGSPRMRLDAWYTPRPIADWLSIAKVSPA